MATRALAVDDIEDDLAMYTDLHFLHQHITMSVWPCNKTPSEKEGA